MSGRYAARGAPSGDRQTHAITKLGVTDKKESKIVQNDPGETFADILTRKKASIKQAPLPSGSPDWDTFMQMAWADIEEGARDNKPGFKVVRKLLTDKRFDK